jgi:hypothetical protein
MHRSPLDFAATLTLTLLIAPGYAEAQSVRDHVRITPDRSTTVTEKQATELTLTVTAAAVQPVFIWLRTAGLIDPSKKVITASVPAGQGELIKVGQRVRAFTRVGRQGERTAVTATLNGQALETSTRYVLEIVAEGGDLLAVPNEAIIEQGGQQIVYVQQSAGNYQPRQIKAGVRGELFTEVVDGLKPGEQVVTIGSFFIDADHKLKN